MDRRKVDPMHFEGEGFEPWYDKDLKKLFKAVLVWFWPRLCREPLIEEIVCRRYRNHTGLHDDFNGHVWSDDWPLTPVCEVTGCGRWVAEAGVTWCADHAPSEPPQREGTHGSLREPIESNRAKDHGPGR